MVAVSRFREQEDGSNDFRYFAHSAERAVGEKVESKRAGRRSETTISSLDNPFITIAGCY